jgi:hypothetical protein
VNKIAVLVGGRRSLKQQKVAVSGRKKPDRYQNLDMTEARIWEAFRPGWE